jgi:hypothetical protein
MLPERTVALLGRPGHRVHERGVACVQVEVVEGDLVGGQNPQQALGNLRGEQRKLLTVPRFPQGAHGLEHCR